METLGDMVEAIQDDLTVGEESNLFSPPVIKRYVNRAYLNKVVPFKPWPELQDAKETTTQNGQEYYDYPQNWRSNSIWKVRIDMIRYGEDPDGSPLSYDDYMNWKEDNPNSTDKKWTNQWRRYFVWPVPTNNTSTICIWGIKTVTTQLSSDTDTTIFSYSTPQANEAIVLEAEAMLKGKDDKDTTGQFKSLEAKTLLAQTWTDISKEMAKYEKDMPFFEVQDFYGKGNSRDMRGRFDI